MAADIFLELTNGIKGESVDSKHAGQIDVLSWNWAMNQSGTTHLGKGGGGGKVQVSDIQLAKYVDLSSNDLIKKCCNGSHIDKATLYVRKAGGEDPLEYFKIEMEHVMITSYQTGGGSDGLDRIMENLTLNFAKFNITYIQQDEKGGQKATATAGWNIAENIKV